MREIIRYEADDGTLFEDESECVEYEWQQNVETSGHLYALLSNKRVLLDNQDTESYDDCHFIFLKNGKSAKALSRIWDEDVIGSYCPDFLKDHDVLVGLWAFNEDNDEWYHVGERIADLEDMANECMQEINKGDKPF